MLTLYRPFLAFAHLPLLDPACRSIRVLKNLPYVGTKSTSQCHFCFWSFWKTAFTFALMSSRHSDPWQRTHPSSKSLSLAQQLPMIPSFSSFKGMVAVSFAPLGTFLCQNRCLSFHATLPQSGMEVTNFGPTIPLRTGLWNCWVIHI